MSHTFDKAVIVLIRNLMITSVISLITFFFIPFLGLILGALGYLISFWYYLKKRSESIQELLTFLQKLNRGDYHYNLEAYDEGELQTLQAELHKTMILLKNANYDLMNQKLFLQTSLENISHQLKTPITSLLILNELQDPEDPLVSKSKVQVERLENLTKSLLHIAKLDAKLIEFKDEPYSTHHLLEQLKTVNAPSLSDNNLNLHIIGNDYPLHCDVQHTLEALNNVMTNKIYYAQSQITIHTSYTGLRTLIKISDDGEAIHSTDRDHLFERFYSGQNKRPDSIGIGLSIAQETMKQMGGNLSLEDDNTFVFSFPNTPQL